MDEKEYYLCKDCCKDIYLKNYVEENIDSSETCSICYTKKKTLNISNSSISEFCRFLIRYHYPEYEYNSHWGGEELPSQFFSENPIISHHFVEDANDKDMRNEEIDEFLNQLFDLENYNSKIELYYGHDANGRNLWATSIKKEKSAIWDYYKRQLLIQNYFHLEEGAKNSFSTLLENLKFTLKADKTFYRARIGYTEKVEDVSLGYNTFKIKIPYSGSQLSSPPILKTTAGRANRQGVAFLYLASDEETALGEIRPHPGHYVSVGQFKNTDNLLLADLRFVDLVKYYNDNEQLKLFKLLKDLSDELSIPILPDEKENYLVTQFISDIIRQIGFDGILFNSSVSKGYNLVAFDPSKFVNLEDQSKLVKINSVNFKYAPIEYERDGFFDILIEK